MLWQGSAIALFLFTSVLSLFSQEMAGPTTTPARVYSASGPIVLRIQRQVQEVNLILSVTDRRGHFVQGLMPSDLKILDDDKQQTTLTFFQSETDLPLHVALVLDMSASIAMHFPQEQQTIRNFLKGATRPMDSVELFAFNERVQFAAPIKNDWKEISRRVRKLKPEGETALFDALCEAGQWLALDHRPARRIMILISDGEENRSHATLDDTIAEVLSDEATIYTVNVLGRPTDSDGIHGAEIMKKLADATGGTYLRANEDGGVGSAFGKIRRELRSQYALAYKPSNLTEHFFHRLRVIAARNLRVRCRTGYYVTEGAASGQ
jgi:Ca-activated chloride channel family protein